MASTESTPAFVTPEVIKWARTRVGASVETLADRIHTKPERLASWEDGEDRPTMRQAMHLAGALHIPFGYLFLTKPPQVNSPIPDFRTVGGTMVNKPSPELIDVLRDAKIKQEWYRDFLLEEG